MASPQETIKLAGLQDAKTDTYHWRQYRVFGTNSKKINGSLKYIINKIFKIQPIKFFTKQRQLDTLIVNKSKI